MQRKRKRKKGKTKKTRAKNCKAPNYVSGNQYKHTDNMPKLTKRVGANRAAPSFLQRVGEYFGYPMKLPATIHSLAALLREDIQLDTSTFPHAEQIKDAAADLLEPHIFGIPRPNFKALKLVATDPAIPQEPASFTRIGYNGQPTIYITNIVTMMAILSANMRSLPHVSEDTLWIMMAIVFCHEMVHAWQAAACPSSAYDSNKCNAETFATFVTSEMTAAEGVSKINEMGIAIMEMLLKTMHARGLPTVSPAYYQKCYVDAARTSKQDLGQMSCASLSGPDVEYGGRQRRNPKRSTTPRRKPKRSATPKRKRSATPKRRAK
jgi:hypothetical protein